MHYQMRPDQPESSRAGAFLDLRFDHLNPSQFLTAFFFSNVQNFGFASRECLLARLI